MKNVIYITADNGTLTRGALLCVKIYKLDFIAKTENFFLKNNHLELLKKLTNFFQACRFSQNIFIYVS